MELAPIFDACQADQLSDWRVIPHATPPDTNLLAALVDEGDQTGPALTAIPHLYRAVYGPDARIGLGWGMDPRNPRIDPERPAKPDWAPDGWRGAEPAYAHVLLNGTMVWRVLYTYVNWGAGVDGVMPFPSRQLEPGPTPLDFYAGGWDTTRWEVEFARLLNDLQGNDEFPFDRELRGWGLKIHEESPLDLTRPKPPEKE